MSPDQPEPGLAFGAHTCRVILRRDPGSAERLFLQEPATSGRRGGLAELARRAGVAVEVVPRAAIEAMLAGDASDGPPVHQGVVLRLKPGEPPIAGWEALLARLGDARETPGSRAPLILVLDGVQDPRNLGACIRAAAGAGVDAVIHPRRRSAGLTAAAQKTASGAHTLVPVIAVPNLARALAALADLGLAVLAVEAAAGTPVFDADLARPCALVLGGEASGLRRLTREHCQQALSIPTPGAQTSLNVAVAAGVVLFEAVRQRRAPSARSH